jgi:hypothetical protein
MPQILTALAAGLLFGLGLTVSGMINPGKVLGFLDVAGDWDPSLAFVMAAAIPVAMIGVRAARRLRTPLCAATFAGPTRTRLDLRLVAGAMLFGVGWGLAGYCPGPALASLAPAARPAGLFVVAMLVGMAAFQWFDRSVTGGRT